MRVVEVGRSDGSIARVQQQPIFFAQLRAGLTRIILLGSSALA